MTVLLAASELDLSDPQSAQLLQPLFPVLDKAWMIPVHVPSLKSTVHLFLSFPIFSHKTLPLVGYFSTMPRLLSIWGPLIAAFAI